MLGYQYKLSSKWSLVGKVGISSAIYLNGEQPSSSTIVFYNTDNGDARGSGITSQTVVLGKPPGFSVSPRYRLDTYECYLGIMRGIHLKWLKKLSAGIEFTRARQKEGDGIIEVNSFAHYGQTINNIDDYHNKNISVGLRIGLNLWP